MRLVTSTGCVGIGASPYSNYRLTLPNSFIINLGSGIARAWPTYSDARIKTDQKQIPYGLKVIMKMQPKSYIHHSSDFKNGKLIIGPGSISIGLIAQELYSLVPEAVGKPEDESKSLWSIDYNKLVPVLVKAIQDQQELIESSKVENNQLKLQLQTLEKRMEQVESLLTKGNIK
jgi:hypothetical protein